MKRQPMLDSRLASYSESSATARTLERRKARLLAGCLLTAGAACVAGSQAQAAIIYHDENPDFQVSAGAGHVTNYINFTNAKANKVGIKYSFAAKSVFAGYITYSAFMARAALHKAAYFAPGNAIGAGAVWTWTWQMLCKSDGTGGNFKNKDGYIGVRFKDTSKAGICYGWIRFQGAANGLSGLIKGWAYQDTAGTAINAGEGQ